MNNITYANDVPKDIYKPSFYYDGEEVRPIPDAEGYYVSTVRLNEATIKKYIQEQEKHDIAMDKLSVKEYEDPFKG